MKQMVVGLLVVVGVFTFGPWFAGKVGPPLADAVIEYATPKEPCATATADPSKKVRPKKDRPKKQLTHAARKHRKPHADQRAKQRRPKPKPSPSCAPTPTS